MGVVVERKVRVLGVSLDAWVRSDGRLTRCVTLERDGQVRIYGLKAGIRGKVECDDVLYPD